PKLAHNGLSYYPFLAPKSARLSLGGASRIFRLTPGHIWRSNVTRYGTSALYRVDPPAGCEHICRTNSGCLGFQFRTGLRRRYGGCSGTWEFDVRFAAA